jgi:hypothetical protein
LTMLGVFVFLGNDIGFAVWRHIRHAVRSMKNSLVYCQRRRHYLAAQPGDT